MNPERFAELCELVIDGDLSPAAALELHAHLDADPTAAEAMRAITREHMLCRTALRPADPALLAERARQMLAAQPPARGKSAARAIMARVDRRRRVSLASRWGGLAAAALLFFAIGFGIVRALHTTAADGKAPRIEDLSGMVRLSGGAAVEAGHLLGVGEAVETDATATATLTWSDGTRIRLAADTRLSRLAGASQHVRLERGAATVQAAHRPEAAALEIVCPDASVVVVGTAFTVTVADGHSRLAVSDGLVRFTRSSDGISSLVGAGQEVAASALPLILPVLMPPDQLAAVRTAIAAGREPWAGSWAALRQRAQGLLTPKAAPPAVIDVPAYNGGNPLHSAARVAIAEATQPALALALAARLGDDERAAAAAVKRIHAWIPVRVQGAEADLVACDTAIALIQAADLLRGLPAWTARDAAALDGWIAADFAPRAERLMLQPGTRRRGIDAAMTVAAWRGNPATVRSLMAQLRSVLAAELSPAALARPPTEEDQAVNLVQVLIFGLHSADLARMSSGDATPPPAEWGAAVGSYLARYPGHARGSKVESEEGFFMRALVGPGPWRTPAAQAFISGPDADRRVVFGWSFPTLTAWDPRSAGAP